MPTPVGHTIGGFVAARTVEPDARKEVLATALFALLFANLADADFLPGLLIDDPRAFHRGFSHSIVGALAVAAAAAAIASRWRVRFRRVFLLTLAVYGSHLVLDTAMPDTNAVAGVPLFWPVSDLHVGYALPLRPDLDALVELPVGADSASFFAAVFSVRALAVFAFEAVLFLPLLLVPRLTDRVRSGRRAGRLRAGRGAAAPIDAPGPQGRGPNAAADPRGDTA